jgi:hypothetical protein
LEVEDPHIAEFATWNSYNLFARRVRHQRPFVWGPGDRAFLDAVRATVSLAHFEVLRTLRLLDLSKGHGKSSFSEIDFKHLIANTQPAAAGQERGRSGSISTMPSSAPSPSPTMRPTM